MSDRPAVPVRRAAAEPRHLVHRILEQPDLVRAVQSLAPRALLALVDEVGLEDAGELVALATTAQLERVFDEDLWRSRRAGEDERFDEKRFALWLEVLLEAGAGFAADRLAELPEELLTLALHRRALVLDLDALALQMSALDEDDVAPIEKRLEATLHHELGQYRIVARGDDGWDALVAVLGALDERHPDLLQRILEHAAAADAERIEDSGGLYDVLGADEMLESDGAAAREDRRARAGYVSPSSAKSFLQLAQASDGDALLARPDRDPMTRAYFREYDEAAAALEAADAGAAAEGARLLELIDAPAPPQRRIEGGASESGRLSRALVELAARDAALHAARLRELGYLANVLVAGAERDGRRYRPFEAAEEALAICERGLARARAATGRTDAELLVRYPCDVLFRIASSPTISKP